MTIIAADSVGRKNKPMTELEAYLPFWGKLIPGQREQLRASAVRRVFEKGDNVRRGPEHCIGLLMVCSGQLRVYITSDSGREVTLYRLFERDICLLSASCMMPNIQFEVSVQAWERTEVVVIPAAVYQELAKTSLPVAAYTSDLMAARLSDVMWLLDQVMNKSWFCRELMRKLPAIWAVPARWLPECCGIFRTRERLVSPVAWCISEMRLC